MKKVFYFSSFLILLIASCSDAPGLEEQEEENYDYFYRDAKPWTRWWWFQAEIDKESIQEQLDWIKESGFGGVEVAWLYPQAYFDRSIPLDSNTVYQKWLTPEFIEIIAYTKEYCDNIELGCDFTAGTAWPFGDTYVPMEESVKIYGDTSFWQRISFSWQWPEYCNVVDHLSGAAVENYTRRILKAFAPALDGSTSGLFCDSWEIKMNASNKLWTDGFGEAFKGYFGYDLIPFMEDSLDNFPHVRYDYMRLISDMLIDSFYIPYHEMCNEADAFDRVQCLASPTDVMTAYSIPDVPESESMLNNPDYSRIVSSAATLAGKREISCETFTCMYGFPKVFNREEQTADLKMVADAMMVNGINKIIWHGTPYNPAGSDSLSFFASVHAYKGGNLESEIPAFNEYIAKVCDFMRRGRTYSDVAVYVPYEDGVMAGPLPEERQRVWIWGEYELRYIHYPKEVEGHHPIWINRHFLENAKYKDGKLICGDAEFSQLYIDVEWMDAEALSAILRFAKMGLPICLKRDPKEPGHRKSKNFKEQLAELKELDNVGVSFIPREQPLCSGKNLPDYWCRKSGKTHYIFFAHPFSQDLAYPITSGQSFTTETIDRKVSIFANGKSTTKTLSFEPYQSIMLRVDPDGTVSQEDISFVPKDPVVKPKGDIRMHF